MKLSKVNPGAPKSPQDSNRRPSDYPHDSDDTSSFWYHPNIKIFRNIDLLGGGDSDSERS